MKRILSALLLCCSLSAGQAYAAAATLLAGTADTGDTPNTSGAFTPTSGDLLVVLVAVANSVDTAPTLSSSTALTFSRVTTTATYSGSADTLYAFVSDALVSNTASQTVTWTEASDPGSGSVIFVYRVSGMSRSGLTAVLQSAAQNNRGAGNSISTAFASAALTGNVTLSIVGNRTNPAGIDPPSGWTEPSSPSGDLGYASPTSGAETTYRNSGFTGTTITWGSTSATQSGALSIELDTTATSSCPATCTGGRTGVCITGTASNTDPDNILYGQSPTVVANQDTICHNATSTNGKAVTVSAAGWVTLASGGSNLTDGFGYCIMDNGAACGTDGTFQITEAPVLSNVTGTQTGQTTATTDAATSQDEGVMYPVVITKASHDTYGTPTHAQLVQGVDGNNAQAAWASVFENRFLTSVPSSWTFTRASAAQTGTTSAGLLYTTTSNDEPAFRYGEGVLLEGSRTNLALYSRDLSNAAWAATNVTKGSTSYTTADGTASTKVLATATAANGTVLQTVTSASATRTYAVRLKRITGTGNIDLTVDGGTTWTTKAITSDWARYWITRATVTNPKFGIRIVTSGDAVLMDYSQLESAEFPSSDITTTTASVTRATTKLIQNHTFPVNNFAGQIKYTSRMPYASVTNNRYIVAAARVTDDTTNALYIYHTNSNRIILAYTNGGNATYLEGNEVINEGDSVNIRFKKSSDGMFLWVNGDAVVSSTTANAKADLTDTLARLKVGMAPLFSVTSPTDAYAVESLQIWHGADMPSDAALEAMP